MLKSIIVGTIVYVIVCLGIITGYLSLVHPLIQGYLEGWKGKLVSATVLFIFLGPLIWAMIARKNHSPEFRRLWANNIVNRSALVALILVKMMVGATIVLFAVVRLFNVASGVAWVITITIIFGMCFSKHVRRRSYLIEEQFSANFQNGGEKKH